MAHSSDLPTETRISSTSPITQTGSSSQVPMGRPTMVPVESYDYPSVPLSVSGLSTSVDTSESVASPSAISGAPSKGPSSGVRLSTSDRRDTGSASPETISTGVASMHTFLTSTVSASTSAKSILGSYGDSASFPYPDGNLPSYESETPDTCGRWVGVEVIIMVDETEVCPEGQTITTTSTETLEIMTRSICATSLSSIPCYICAFGLPNDDDLMTVTITSHANVPEAEPTIAAQMCEGCKPAVVRMAVPGLSAGQKCHGCAVSSSGSGTDASVETTTLSDVQTISLGGNSAASITGVDKNNPMAASEKQITPTPFSGATGNTPPGPASALPTYATAGSAHSSARAGMAGSALMAVVVVLAW